MRLRAVAWGGGEPRHRGDLSRAAPSSPRSTAASPPAGGRGFSVVVIDWRGQGLSDRHPANAMLGHIEDFRDYQRDVAALLDARGAARPARAALLVAHSMGGCIGLRTLLERADFCGAIFSAPMWHLQMRAATRELTGKMTRLANIVGLGMRLMPGTRAQPTAIAVGFAGNAADLRPGRSSPGASDQITTHPELSLGGPSMQWTYAALEEMARLYVGAAARAAGARHARQRGDRGLARASSAARWRRWPKGRLLTARRPARDLHGAAGDPGRGLAPRRRRSWPRSPPGAVAWLRAEAGSGLAGRSGRSAAQATSLRTRARSNSRRRCASGIA